MQPIGERTAMLATRVFFWRCIVVCCQDLILVNDSRDAFLDDGDCSVNVMRRSKIVAIDISGLKSRRFLCFICLLAFLWDCSR